MCDITAAHMFHKITVVCMPFANNFDYTWLTVCSDLFALHVYSLGIKPTTFRACNAVLDHLRWLAGGSQKQSCMNCFPIPFGYACWDRLQSPITLKGQRHLKMHGWNKKSSLVLFITGKFVLNRKVRKCWDEIWIGIYLYYRRCTKKNFV